MSKESKNRLIRALLMDDAKPMAIARLTDDELCEVCCSNYGTDWVMEIIETHG